MTDEFKTPAGPNEMHPIRGGMDQDGYTDFRAKPPAQTAFEKYMEETAFNAQQRAEQDAAADAADFLEGREPKTAFELEMSGGRRPLDAQESAQPSLFDPIHEVESVLKEPQVASASVAKETKDLQTPPAPKAPKQPSI